MGREGGGASDKRKEGDCSSRIACVASEKRKRETQKKDAIRKGKRESHWRQRFRGEEGEGESPAKKRVGKHHEKRRRSRSKKIRGTASEQKEGSYKPKEKKSGMKKKRGRQPP